jgi:hypothetical protein
MPLYVETTTVSLLENTIFLIIIISFSILSLEFLIFLIDEIKKIFN